MRLHTGHCNRAPKPPRACAVCGGGPVRTTKRAHAPTCIYAPGHVAEEPLPCRSCLRVKLAQERSAAKRTIIHRLRTAPTFDALGRITRDEEMARSKKAAR